VIDPVEHEIEVAFKLFDLRPHAGVITLLDGQRVKIESGLQESQLFRGRLRDVDPEAIDTPIQPAAHQSPAGVFVGVRVAVTNGCQIDRHACFPAPGLPSTIMLARRRGFPSTRVPSFLRGERGKAPRANESPSAALGAWGSMQEVSEVTF